MKNHDWLAARQRNEQAFKDGERERREQIAAALVILAGQIQAGTASALIVNQAASLVTVAHGVRPLGLDSRLRSR